MFQHSQFTTLTLTLSLYSHLEKPFFVTTFGISSSAAIPSRFHLTERLIPPVGILYGPSCSKPTLIFHKRLSFSMPACAGLNLVAINFPTPPPPILSHGLILKLSQSSNPTSSSFREKFFSYDLRLPRSRTLEIYIPCGRCVVCTKLVKVSFKIIQLNEKVEISEKVPESSRTDAYQDPKDSKKLVLLTANK